MIDTFQSESRREVEGGLTWEAEIRHFCFNRFPRTLIGPGYEQQGNGPERAERPAMAENKVSPAQQRIVTACTIIGFLVGMGAMFAMQQTGMIWGAIYGVAGAGLGSGVGQAIALAMQAKK